MWIDTSGESRSVVERTTTVEDAGDNPDVLSFCPPDPRSLEDYMYLFLQVRISTWSHRILGS